MQKKLNATNTLPNQEFIFKNWQTPSCIDSEPFEVLNTEQGKAVFRKKIFLKNYQNFQFKAQIDRTISILPQNLIDQEISAITQSIKQEEKEFVITKQLLKSGTAIGTLVREA